VLIQRWHDRCFEIRAASQSLVLNELGRIGHGARRRECERWMLFMPSYITAQLAGACGPSPTQWQPPAELDLQFDENCDAALFTRLCAANAYETRRRNATSIVMLGVLAAEFGSEFEQLLVVVGATGCTLEPPGASRTPSQAQLLMQLKSQLPSQPQLQSLAQNVSYPMSVVACRALTHILVQAGSSRLPPFSPIRKCA
jgi:hypothetical protein